MAERHVFSRYVTAVAVIVVIRLVSVCVGGRVYREKKDDRFILFSMLPRGLASAVLATLPTSANIEGCELFVSYTFAVIVLTNVLMTA